MGTYNIASDYKLCNSVIFNSGTNVYVFNNWVRFISEIKPIIDYVYTGLYIKEIVGYSTAIVMIDMPKGKE